MIIAVSPKCPCTVGPLCLLCLSEDDSQSAAGPWTPPCPSWSFTAGYNRELLPGPGTILRAVAPTGRFPADLPTRNSAVWRQFVRVPAAVRTSLSFHSSGARSCSVSSEETRAAATTDHLLKVTSSLVPILLPPPPPHLVPSSHPPTAVLSPCAWRVFRFSPCASTSTESSPGRPPARPDRRRAQVVAAAQHVTRPS